MRQRRINLFRELVQGNKKGRQPGQPIKLGTHAIVCIVASILFVAFIGPTLWNYHRDSADMDKRIVEARAELVKLTQQTETIVNQIAEERRLAALNPNGKDGGTKEGSDKTNPAQAMGSLVPIDQTWTSVLWKLSTFTTSAIVITKMDFQDSKDKGQGTAARKIVIDGQAGSQLALTDWMDQLANTMPTAELVMDRQVATSRGDKFPIEFKVTATIL